MVKTTETDIVSPTITTEDPYRFLSKVILLSKYFWSCWASICCCLFKFCNKSFCSWCVCLSIILCLKVLSCCCLKAVCCLIRCSHFFDLGNSLVTKNLLSKIHTKTMFCVILE